MGYNLLINGVYGGYNPLTNHLLTSWDIQVVWKLTPEVPEVEGHGGLPTWDQPFSAIGKRLLRRVLMHQ